MFRIPPAWTPQAIALQMISAAYSVFRHYLTFRGRSQRSVYWFFQADLLVFALLFRGLFAVTTSDPLLYHGLHYVYLFLLALLFIPNIMLTIRRLHDGGFRGFWFLLAFIPFFGWFAILLFMLVPSMPAGEKYGPYQDAPPPTFFHA